MRFRHKTSGHKGKGAILGSGKKGSDPREKRETQGITQEQRLGRVEVKSTYSPLHVTRALVSFVHCVFAAFRP